MKKLIAAVFAAVLMAAGLVTVSGGPSTAADYPPVPPVQTVGSVTAPKVVKAKPAKKKKKTKVTITAGATSVKNVVGTLIIKVTPNDGKGFNTTKVFPNVTSGTSVKWTTGKWPKKGTKKYKKFKGKYTVTVTFTPADPAVATPSAPVTYTFTFK